MLPNTTTLNTSVNSLVDLSRLFTKINRHYSEATLNSKDPESLSVTPKINKANFDFIDKHLSDYFIFRSYVSSEFNNSVKIPLYHDSNSFTKTHQSNNFLRFRFPFTDAPIVLNSVIRLRANTSSFSKDISYKLNNTQIFQHSTVELLYEHFKETLEYNNPHTLNNSAILIRHVSECSIKDFILESFSFSKEHFAYKFNNKHDVRIGEDVILSLSKDNIVSLQIMNELVSHFSSLNSSFDSKAVPTSFSSSQEEWQNIVDTINSSYLTKKLDYELSSSKSHDLKKNKI